MFDFSEPHARAIKAVGELLTRQQLDFMFVGSVARVAWLGGTVDSGPIDVLATMQAQQKGQVAMVASNRGFTLDRDEVEATEELDLIPMSYEGVRVHILVASNALYARMIKDAWYERIGENDWRVPAREDLAFLYAMAEDAEVANQLKALPEFDRSRYNALVTSIGLKGLAV